MDGRGRRGRRYTTYLVERRLHSLMMPEIATCLLIDTTRCLAGHARVFRTVADGASFFLSSPPPLFFSTTSFFLSRSTGPRRPGPQVESGTGPISVDDGRVEKGNPHVDQPGELDSGVARLNKRGGGHWAQLLNFLGYKLAEWIINAQVQLPRPRTSPGPVMLAHEGPARGSCHVYPGICSTVLAQ